MIGVDLQTANVVLQTKPRPAYPAYSAYSAYPPSARPGRCWRDSGAATTVCLCGADTDRQTETRTQQDR